MQNINMQTFEQYWAGTGGRPAVVETNDFSSDLANIMYRRVSGLSFCNQAFQLFYNARLSIRLCRDPTQQTPMRLALEDAAESGAGFGDVDNLKEIFEYMDQHQSSSNPRWWTDDDVSQYTAGNFFNGTVHAPTGIVNFAKAIDVAIDEAGSDLRDVIDQFGALHQTINDELRRTGAHGGEPDFTRIRESISSVSTWAGKAGKILWLADASGMLSERVQGVVDTATGAVGAVGNFTGHVNTILEALNNYVALENAEVTQDNAIGLSLLGAISSKIPIIGQIYAEAINITPQLARNYQSLFDRTNRSIAAIIEAASDNPTNTRGMGGSRAPQALPTGVPNARKTGRLPGPIK